MLLSPCSWDSTSFETAARIIGQTQARGYPDPQHSVDHRVRVSLGPRDERSDTRHGPQKCQATSDSARPSTLHAAWETRVEEHVWFQEFVAWSDLPHELSLYLWAFPLEFIVLRGKFGACATNVHFEHWKPCILVTYLQTDKHHSDCLIFRLTEPRRDKSFLGTGEKNYRGIILVSCANSSSSLPSTLYSLKTKYSSLFVNVAIYISTIT